MLSYLLFKVASLNCLSVGYTAVGCFTELFVGYTAVGCAVVRARHSGGRQRLRHGLLKLRSLYKLHEQYPIKCFKGFSQSDT